jgi:four helix bundle protein
MIQNSGSKPYDLGERTFLFAKNVIGFVDVLPKTIANIEIAKQVVRSSGSVGANYIEANESISKKDFALRIKICRKEAKESKYWLSLIETKDTNLDEIKNSLAGEAYELTKIFNSIAEKSQ